jgi:ABC-type phosphate transport system substrate-binding protein
MLREATNTKHIPGRVWRLLRCVPLAILATAPVAAQEANRIRVIVSADNPVEQLERPEVARIFLGQLTSWRNGTKIRPVDQSLTSLVRKEFSSAVLRQSLLVVNNYWQQQIFAGRAAPPPVRDTDARVVEFVSATPGAIGYVSAGHALPKGVKALAMSE